MMVGLMGLQSFTKIFQGVSTSIKKNKPLYAFRQVQPITSAVTSGFLELIIKAIVGVLLALATYLLGMSFSLNDPLLFLFLCFNLGLLSFALGLIFAVGSAFVPETDKIKALMTRPLMFISCVFFSLQDIPQAYWHFFTWNPLVHFNELVRYSFFESYGDQGVSLSYLVKFTFLSLFLSLSMYHITWKKVLSR
jgi:capsular polysaccharide transport system permease protein